MKEITQRIFGLDLIRATAILLIMCSHSVVLLAPNSTETIPFAIKFLGTIGVDVFFVLSGFLIGSILLKQIQANETKPKDFVYFWVRRWFRTLPNYYLVLLINIMLVIVFNRIDDFSILKFSLFLQNFNSAQANFFTESWSLTIEEFSYILLPFILLLIGVSTKKVTQTIFLIVTFAVIGFSILDRLYFHFYLVENLTDASWSSALRKVVIYRLDSIYYGFIGAYIFLNRRLIWDKYKVTSFVIGVLLFIALHVYIVINQFQPNVNSLFFNVIYLTGLSISILLLFPLVYNLKFGGFIKTFITKISQWSYALYLVNYSMVLITINDFITVESQSIIAKMGMLILFWLVSIGLSVLLYTYYEQPILKLRDSHLVRRFFKKS